ncbi:amino acid adenylation domain-containing protein [Streptomyces sp. JJ38]|uniref:non-ribosomal peptide synthetase n=1 Tax=Streptomyces sp. JJ38 TaxID=2738128 RepID=UPI001C5896D3|nr:non-ribosomal peptide synthetase [Streptomyces sp. JJ38]MBW1598369.1 non-ribosomal peptide synthetase [Streptomyces sp. JJ38]
MMQQNDGRDGSDPGATVHSLFERHAELDPGRTAVVAAGRSLTYGELNSRSNQVAWRLRELGVGADTMVGICVERSPDMFVGLLAVLKAGGAYVPLDPGYPADRLTFMLRDSRVSVVVTQRDLESALPEHDAVTVLLDDDSDPFGGCPTGNPPAVCGAGNLAYVLYTSGSTGRPKGVLVTHDGVVNLVTGQDYVSVGPEDRVAALATLAFDASTFEIWGPLANGATCVVYTFVGDDLAGLCAKVRDDGVTVLHLTSPVFRQLAAEHFRALNGVRTLLFGGDSVRSDLETLARESFQGELVHLYGPTETTGFATFHVAGSTAENAAVIPIGRPVNNVVVRILGPDGSAVGPGEQGELYIGGRGVARGYLNQPGLTGERFVSQTDGTGAMWYRTGDLVRRDDFGVLHFLGRGDRQVKVRGYRVEPGAVESVLTRHPQVSDAVVVAREDGDGDKRLDAYVVPASGRRAQDEADRQRLVAGLREHMSGVLPEHQHPASLTVIPAVPLTANLKLDQERLPEPVADRRPSLGAVVRPTTHLETALAELWSAKLGAVEVGLDDDFFALGGDSISAVQLAAATTTTLGLRITVRDMFKYPTIRQLSRLLSEHEAAERHAGDTVRCDG